MERVGLQEEDAIQTASTSFVDNMGPPTPCCLLLNMCDLRTWCTRSRVSCSVNFSFCHNQHAMASCPGVGSTLNLSPPA